MPGPELAQYGIAFFRRSWAYRGGHRCIVGLKCVIKSNIKEVITPFSGSSHLFI
jgi:hypothetical protein